MSPNKVVFFLNKFGKKIGKISRFFKRFHPSVYKLRLPTKKLAPLQYMMRVNEYIDFKPNEIVDKDFFAEISESNSEFPPISTKKLYGCSHRNRKAFLSNFLKIY